MLIQDVTVTSNKLIAENTYVLEIHSTNLYKSLNPGQFFNIQVSENSFPLLRRPFSICDVSDESIFFMYKVVGEGTKILSEKKSGDKLNFLGPLGNCFEIGDQYEHLIILGGGIGIAPFPYLLRKLDNNLEYSVLFGVRNKSEVHSYGLENILYSSDDGSIGLAGNVIELLKKHITEDFGNKKVKIVGCGPNPMLRALKIYSMEIGVQCDVSMESAMACGFGICQGCPIEHNEDESYKLICKDGPIFNIKDIEI